MTASRSFMLDILRILLCGCVLLCHFYPGSHALAGQVGVLGFFVLSGYLLQASFYRMETGFDVERFYASKSGRLLPAYVCCIIPSVFMQTFAFCNGGEFLLPPVEKHVFSVFQYVWTYNIAAWYMGCLFVFLLMAPFLWWLHRTRWGLPFFFVMAFSFTSFLYWRHNGTTDVLMGMEGRMCPYPQVRLWQFLAGMMAARIAHAGWRPTSLMVRRLLSAAILLILLVLALWVSVYFRRGYALPNCYWFDVCVVLMLGGVTLLWDDGCACSRPRIGQLVAWVASLTYGVYLFHLPIRGFVRVCWVKLPLGALSALSQGIIVLLLTLILSMLAADVMNRVTAWYRQKS